MSTTNYQLNYGIILNMKKSVFLSATAFVVGIGAAVAEASVEVGGGWRLRYRTAAEWSQDGWKTSSLPLGNGWFGISEFGGVDVERLQLTEPSFQTRLLLRNRKDWPEGNLTDAADVSVDFGHAASTGYLRELDLETGLASVKYTADGVEYEREYFA